MWCQAEAGPYQAIPQPGRGWATTLPPPRLPHEYIRGGTAKLLTLFHPATGAVRAKGVTHTPNTVLHPWLQAELLAILAALPPRSTLPRSPLCDWAHWLGRAPRAPLPPLRVLLIWDHLAGHYSAELGLWLFQHGVMPLYTPLSGSWLNRAESVQRILGGRALAGQHPRSPEELIAWLDDTVAGWNQHPPPFTWAGKRPARRQRARQRRLGGSGAALPDRQSLAA
ncbi:MAG: hypothetical protein ACJ8H8_26725 [Geminicoccaceae bacterium]